MTALQSVDQLVAHLSGPRASSESCPAAALRLDCSDLRLFRRAARRRHLVALDPLRHDAGSGAQARLLDLGWLSFLATVAIPLLPNAALATAGMSLSYFWVCCVEHQPLHVADRYLWSRRAAFAVAALVFAYGAMQSVVSQPLASVIERYGFQPVCFLFALLPLASYADCSPDDSQSAR